MRRQYWTGIGLLVIALTVAGGLRAWQARPTTSPADDAAENATLSGLTIYNQGFAVVRQTVPLQLTAGVNNLRFNGTTAHVEPESVILRDPSGVWRVEILEQNYRADPISQELLLSLYEGRELDFNVVRDGKQQTIRGRIIRSGYVPHPAAWRRYGEQYYRTQMQMMGWNNPGGAAQQPIVEVDGRLHFGLPGQPIFPALSAKAGDDTILKPTLDWVLRSERGGTLNAELSYVTGGMSWEADYNVVAPAEGDLLDVAGWVTFDNQSGKTFANAQVKLMAGDVSKLAPGSAVGGLMSARNAALDEARPQTVTERSFDEYHLYTVERRVTLRDRETKQVEFLKAGGVKGQRLYVYDGARIDWNRYQGYTTENILHDQAFGTVSNPKVWVMREIANSKANRLGMPLPKGRVRFYRRDEGNTLQFVGENVISHTPSNEMVRLYTGNAFDIVGERRRTDYKVDSSARWVDEAFEIRLRNRKKEPVEVRVVERLYRWHNWQITRKPADYRKLDSQTIEFRVKLAPDSEQVLNYAVHYTW